MEFPFEGFDTYTTTTDKLYEQAYTVDGSAAGGSRLIGPAQHSHVWTITDLNGFTQTLIWGYLSSQDAIYYDNADNVTVQWNRMGLDLSLTHCYQQRFDSAGVSTGLQAVTPCNVDGAVPGVPLSLPVMAVNGAGNEVAVQTFAQMKQYGLSGETYDASGLKQESKAFVIAEPPLQLVSPSATVAMDPSGNFVVAWVQTDGSTNQVMARSYHAQ